MKQTNYKILNIHSRT